MQRIGYPHKRAPPADRPALGLDPGKDKHGGQLLNPEGLPLGKAFKVPVSHSGYTETLWKELAARLPAFDPAHLVVAIETACNLWYPSYSSRRLRHESTAPEYWLGRDHVRRLMRVLGLEAIYPEPRPSRPAR